VNKVLIFALSSVLFACATKTAFKEQVDANGMGYRYEKIPNDEASFDVTVRVEKGVDPSYVLKYEMRAAGEVCAKHGFEYFDLSQSFVAASLQGQDTRKFFVTCFKAKSRMAVNVVFVSGKNKNESTPDLKIEELPAGVDTPLKVGDVVTAVNGTKVKTVYDVKKAVRAATLKNKKSVEVDFIRAEKELHAKVLMHSAETNLGPKELEALRAATN